MVVGAVLTVLAGCSAPSEPAGDRPADDGPPERFTIVPDDFHVPYAGTAEDGRRFFLSDELFTLDEPGAEYVGLFLWQADGSFDEVRVDLASPADGLPAGAEELVESRLAELGDYVLEPIEVEPFTTEVDGVTFGWRVDQYDGTYVVSVAPGDFIAYYAPWDGLGYDT
jgi:hypothetical protein